MIVLKPDADKPGQRTKTDWLGYTDLVGLGIDPQLARALTSDCSAVHRNELPDLLWRCRQEVR